MDEMCMADALTAKREPLSPSGGFTLIELLLVVTVLGILATMIVFALGGTAGDASVASCNSDAKDVELAVEAFYLNPNNTADPHHYPNPSTGTPSGDTQLTAPTSSNYGGPYLRTWPSSTHYMITLDPSVPGQVDVNGQNFDGQPNPCTSVS
jgi:general secretion pathway protein G